MKKNIQRTIIAVFCLILLSSTLTSCVQSVAKDNITEDKGAIPPDFGKDTSAVLLAIKSGKNSYDKYLISNFKAYEGPYKVISVEELNSNQYANKEKFKYVFNFDFEHREGIDRTDSGFNVRRFSIYDRVNDKKYVSNMTSSFFGKMMKAYISNLNGEIKKSK